MYRDCYKCIMADGSYKNNLQSLSFLASSFKYLLVLDLRHCSVIHPSLLFQGKQLPAIFFPKKNLTYFKILTDEIAEQIGETCQLLKGLELASSGSSHLGRNGAPIFRPLTGKTIFLYFYLFILKDSTLNKMTAPLSHLTQIHLDKLDITGKHFSFYLLVFFFLLRRFGNFPIGKHK